MVQLIWNAENRLSEVRDSSGTTLASYSYDHLGRRIARVTEAGTTFYLYDGWNPIAEYTGTSLVKSYTWGMDLSGSMQGAGGVGGLLAVKEVSNLFTYYPTYDGNGNISEYLDNSGTVQAHYEYDAFGNETVKTGTKADDFAHRFSTKPKGAETGLYYYGYRYYDPVTGRWPSRDPIEEDGGINLYAFVGNDGINYWDSFGLYRKAIVFSEKTEVLVLNADTDVQSRPGSTSFNPLSTYMGLSGLGLNVKASCVCVDGMLWWSKYQLLHVDAEFVYKVWLRPKGSYKSESHRRFAHAAEKDHLREFRAWALTDGKRVVSRAYLDAVGKWHDSKKACELAAERLILSRLDTAFVAPFKESGRYHDRSGRHTWGDKNARPVPPASVNVDDPQYFSPSNM